MQERPVVVVGSSNTDMVVVSQRIPKPGETITGGRFVMAAGGKGANQAVAAARLGAKVSFIARVGDDLFGQQSVEGYRHEGIDVQFVARDPGQHTGVALILVDQGGENSISVASGANAVLSPADVDRAAACIRSARALLLQLETPLPTVCRAAAIAAEAGVSVILDPAPAPDEPLPAELLRCVDFLTPNETEAQRLTGLEVHDETTARTAADCLLRSGPKHVIITLGAKGALLAGPAGTQLIPAFKIEPRDTTAAGDAFNGGLGAALAEELPITEAIRVASAAGALAATRMGAQPSLPTREELEAFLRRQ